MIFRCVARAVIRVLSQVEIILGEDWEAGRAEYFAQAGVGWRLSFYCPRRFHDSLCHALLSLQNKTIFNKQWAIRSIKKQNRIK